MNRIKVLVVLLFLHCVPIRAQVAGSMNCEALRIKWTEFLTGKNYNIKDSKVKAKLNIIGRNATAYRKNGFASGTTDRKVLWTDLKYDKSADLTSSYTRLYTMALAYRSPGAEGYQNPQLRNDIVAALQWLYTYHFNERTVIPKSGGKNNWWDYRIGSPEKLNNIMVLLYDDISPDWRAAYLRTIKYVTPDVGTYTGANLLWISRIIAVSGILAEDTTRVRYAVNALGSVFNYVTEGDGFYADGSFIQHQKHPYSAGYGVSLVTSLAELIYLFPSIPHDIPASNHIYKWIYDSYLPIVYRGRIMSAMMGREIARINVNEYNRAKMLTEAIILLAQQAPKAEAARLKRIAKAYIMENGEDKAGFSTITLIEMANVITADRSVQQEQEYATYRQFSSMDRAVQQTKDYAFTLSMHSSRIYNFESINEENLKGWHTSDGMTYLYNSDTGQFEDNFWSTVDFQHLPGTTTLENSTAVPNKTSTKSWVGGTGILDRYGVSGMDLSPFGTTLSGKKSWFMFDDEIVCLGAGIVNEDDKNVFTTIEQRKLSKENDDTFLIDGERMAPSFEISGRPGIHWMHLSGKIKGADIGYYFPEGTVLNLSRAARTGRWSELRTGTDDALQTRNYLTFWKDHGKHRLDVDGPENKYAYVLLPGYSVNKTKQYVEKPDVQVLHNTSAVQSVRDPGLGLTAANIWKDSISTVFINDKPYFSCDKKASIMVMEKGDHLNIAVSDPTMLNEGTILLNFSTGVSGLISADPEIKVLQLKPVLQLSIAVKGLRGKTVNVVFKK